jgi:hypothetical protein
VLHSVFVDVVSDGVSEGSYLLVDSDGGWPGDSCSDFNNTNITGGGGMDPAQLTAL